jgi:hypothetical protein
MGISKNFRGGSSHGRNFDEFRGSRRFDREDRFGKEWA